LQTAFGSDKFSPVGVRGQLLSRLTSGKEREEWGLQLHLGRGYNYHTVTATTTRYSYQTSSYHHSLKDSMK